LHAEPVESFSDRIDHLSASCGLTAWNPRRDLGKEGGRIVKILTVWARVRQWKTSQKGNPYINADGFNIIVFQRADGGWGGRIEDRATTQSIMSRRRYETENQAKLAAFDTMIFLKNEKGWDRC
jgi:hypothetical protein